MHCTFVHILPHFRNGITLWSEEALSVTSGGLVVQVILVGPSSPHGVNYSKPTKTESAED